MKPRVPPRAMGRVKGRSGSCASAGTHMGWLPVRSLAITVLDDGTAWQARPLCALAAMNKCTLMPLSGALSCRCAVVLLGSSRLGPVTISSDQSIDLLLAAQTDLGAIPAST